MVAEIVSLTLPVANVGRVPCARLDTRLTPRQQTALRRLFDGLQVDDAQMHLGVVGGGMSPVRTQGDAVRWLLDQVADGIGLGPDDYLRAV